MKFYAINGSPRKNRNTATVLQAALDGIASAAAPGEAETEMIHLSDYPFTPCTSCFACKRLGGASYGACALRDPLAPVLKKLSAADGLIFGSPIYLANITGALKAFLERLLFPYAVYDRERSTLAPRRMPTAFVYTMNVPEAMMEELGYRTAVKDMESFVGRMFQPPESLYIFNTYQFDNYADYKMEIFSEAEKAAYREEVFPRDLAKAHAMGVSMFHKATAMGPENR